MKNTLRFFLVLLFFVLLFSATAITSTDFSQDLGRHLKLGEIILTTKHIPQINLFSYTFPKFPFINHHWLSEVIFYWFYQFHPYTLSMLKICLVLFAFFFTMQSARKKSNIFFAVLSASIFFPLFLDRNDIRPELFGYVFYSILLAFLLDDHLRKKYNLLIPVILFFWVNTHISFVFGGGLLLLICLDEGIKVVGKKRSSNTLLMICIAFFTLFINPSGVEGALYPFRIFGNYGYPIVENQNLFFLFDRIFNPLIRYFFMISPFGVVTLLFLLLKKRFTELILVGFMFTLSVVQIRHFPFYVITVIPFSSQMFHAVNKYVTIRFSESIKYNVGNLFSIFLCIVLGVFSLFFTHSVYFKIVDSEKRFGFGFDEVEKEATDFILRYRLSKNIFNTFDIGGYLAYRLYPQYKLFIDNRPEAYPSDFIQKVYIPLQEKPEIQEQVFQKYSVRTVIVNHTDQTPWANSFLLRLIHDQKWRLVFVNSRVIVFTRDQITDIRNNDELWKNKLVKEYRYLNLLRYAHVLSLLGKTELSELSFDKALDFSQYSCAMQRMLISQQENAVFNIPNTIRKRPAFWCI